MPSSLSLLYVEAHTFILQSLSSAFLSRSTSHFPQATPSSLHLAFPIIKFPSPEMKLPVHGLSQGRRAHQHSQLGSSVACQISMAVRHMQKTDTCRGVLNFLNMDICGGDDNWFVAHFMYCMASDGGMIDE
jgi:hypothetical protein